MLRNTCVGMRITNGGSLSFSHAQAPTLNYWHHNIHMRSASRRCPGWNLHWNRARTSDKQTLLVSGVAMREADQETARPHQDCDRQHRQSCDYTRNPAKTSALQHIFNDDPQRSESTESAHTFCEKRCLALQVHVTVMTFDDDNVLLNEQHKIMPRVEKKRSLEPSSFAWLRLKNISCQCQHLIFEFKTTFVVGGSNFCVVVEPLNGFTFRKLFLCKRFSTVGDFFPHPTAAKDKHMTETCCWHVAQRSLQ